MRKLLIPLYGGEVAPRFDLSTEILVVACTPRGNVEQEKVLILPGPSSERICQMAMTEQVNTILCGGIEQEVYEYLTWKKIEVIDNLIGIAADVLQRYLAGHLRSGEVVTSGVSDG